MGSDQTSTPSQDITDALRIAGQMIDAGIPVFAAPPCPGTTCPRKGHQDGRFQYDLPAKWQLTVPSPVWLERWQPGWALAAVGGHRADFLDEDPRNGGTTSVEELKGASQMPRIFGVQATPSGGYHYVISPLHERETNAFMPGLDYQGGRPDGKGRAFIWIAPTVKRAKIAPYTDVAYFWLQEPDLDYLREFDADDSIEGLRDRILARKERKERDEPERQRLEERAFTEEEARRFCAITTDRLMGAEIGQIENLANSAACQLSHFVPEFWSEEFAYRVLVNALGETAYDPGHPAAGWTAEKFHDVLAGVDGRAPSDWEAVRKPESLAEVIPETDAVDALIAEMLSPEQIALHEPPRPLIKGLLTLDSESWLIGEPGSKKSFVALDMAAHVATGRAWQGLKVTQARVVMIVAEGAGGSGLRVRAWEKTYGLMGAEIFILPRPVQAMNLTAWAVLVEACRRLKPGLVVIDTQARVTVGLEENSAKEMGIYVEAVRAVREATGACVLTVHHTGRKGGDARGSSAIDGAQSTELKVVALAGLRGELLTTKQKDLEQADKMSLLFERVALDVDEDGGAITSLILCADPYRKAADGPDGIVLAEDWARNWPTVQEQILTVLVDQGGDIGLTKAEARTSVSARWYDGKVYKRQGDAPRRDLALTHSTFYTAWSKVREARSASGDPIVANPSGEKFVVDPVAREAWSREHHESV
jgi:AAA domain